MDGYAQGEIRERTGEFLERLVFGAQGHRPDCLRQRDKLDDSKGPAQQGRPFQSCEQGHLPEAVHARSVRGVYARERRFDGKT